MAADSPKTILVVDDDRELLELVSFVLEDEGYRVKLATDGREALGQVEQGLPDLILLDMKMPVMDGWQFAREFHARYDQETPIVVITAADDARKRAEEVGAVGWIVKPFDIDVLARTVERQLSSRRGGNGWRTSC